MPANTSPARHLAFALAIAVTAAAATTASAQTFMSEEELLATIPGATIDGKGNDGTRWAQAYSQRSGKSKAGVLSGVYGKDKYKAKWRVKDGQWCEDWGKGNACWQVERLGQKQLRMYRNGKADGNPWVIR